MLLTGLAMAAALAAPARAFAAIDLGGYYAPILHEDSGERGPGPLEGDFTGLPINEAGRSRGNTWDSSVITLMERQCIPNGAPYGTRGAGMLRLWDVRDSTTQQLLRIDQRITTQSQAREIWMDGRPPAPDWMVHTWQGYSIGSWDGDVLVVKTTHLKPGFIRRNGVPTSDRATLIERYSLHGDILNHVMMVDDPVYLSEPMIKTSIYRRVAVPVVGPYPCTPSLEVDRPKGQVPHNPLGSERNSKEVAARYGLPIEAVRGGAETILPEFIDKHPALPLADRRLHLTTE